MQFLSLISLALSAFCASATAETGKFETYQSLSKSHAPIDLDDSVYNDLVSKPRDYHAAVLLTAR